MQWVAEGMRDPDRQRIWTWLKSGEVLQSSWWKCCGAIDILYLCLDTQFLR